MTQIQIRTEDFEVPLKISTHERCSTPCPAFRDRITGHDEFEFNGFWGPYIETADGDTIAEGHKSLSVVLDAVLGAEDEPTATQACETWDCENDASHTVEIATEYRRYTSHLCVECIDPDRSSVATVDEGLEVNICANDRCFNVIPASRTHCTSHGERQE